MDKTHTIDSLTNDILEELESLEKTAAESSPVAPEYKTDLARELVKIAGDLKKLASSGPEVTYSDLAEFRKKVGL